MLSFFPFLFTQEKWIFTMNTPSPLAPTALWRHPNFLKLWAGSTVSLFGSQITFLALPFTAVLLLHATAKQMSFLVFAETLPYISRLQPQHLPELCRTVPCQYRAQYILR